MNYIGLALRSLKKRGQSNIIKILSLSVGLAAGLILIAKITFEQTYDNYYPDKERIYSVQTLFGSNRNAHFLTSGGIAPAMKSEIPEVEAATRLTFLDNEISSFTTEDKNRYDVRTVLLADSCLFDVLPQQMIIGNAKEILGRPMSALISKSVAERMGGDVIGKVIELDNYPDRKITIGGIFEDVPENSHQRYNILISLSSIANFIWDGSKGWVGNERYMSYVKLYPNTDPKSLAIPILEMQKRNMPLDKLKLAGVEIGFTLTGLTSLHIGGSGSDVSKMMLMLSLIAFTLIAVSVMNYVLIVISSLMGRVKEIAIYKSYGAEGKDISKLVFSEILLHIILSLLIGAGLIFLFRGEIENLLFTSLGGLLSLRSILFLSVISLLVLIITGLIPAHIFSRIPVANAFRSMTQSNGTVRLILIGFQFILVAFIITLLAVIGRQYSTMLHSDLGYSYEKLVYTDMSGLSEEERHTVLNAVRQLGVVEVVSTANSLLFEGHGGNNFILPEEDDKVVVNIADLYDAQSEYLSLMKIPLLEGRMPSVESEILISEKGARLIEKNLDWADGIIGKSLGITGHDQKSYTIVGVCKDVCLGSVIGPDGRAFALFHTDIPCNNIIIKLKNMDAASIGAVQNQLKTLFPDKNLHVKIYEDSIVKLYDGVRVFRNSILIGGLITLIIALAGLVGYATNEARRRAKEVAIRWVNGATVWEIIWHFTRKIFWIALPTIAIGEFIGYLVSKKWMDNFAMKAPFSLTLLVVCGLLLILIILVVVCISNWQKTRANPAEILKNN